MTTLLHVPPPRRHRLIGGLLALVLIVIGSTVLTSASAPPAAAARQHHAHRQVQPGRHGVGLTLLGQWVGTWRVPEGSGFCVDFALGHPDSTGAGRLGTHRVPGMTRDQSAQVAVVASRYGRTRSRIDAAAAALVVWRTQHTRRFDRFYARLIKSRALPHAVHAAVRRIDAESRRPSPFRMIISLGSGLVGQQVTGTVRLQDHAGAGVAGVPVRLDLAPTAELIRARRTTDARGSIVFGLRVTQPGPVRVQARADVPSPGAVLITRPSRGRQHLVLAGPGRRLQAKAASLRAPDRPSVVAVCQSTCAGSARVTVTAVNPCGAARLQVLVLRDGRGVRDARLEVAGCRRGQISFSAADGSVITTRYCFLDAKRRCVGATLAFAGTLRVECPPRPQFRLTAGCPCDGSKLISYGVRGPTGSRRSYRATLTVPGRSLELVVVNGQWRSFAPVAVPAGSIVELSYSVLGRTQVLDRFHQLS